MIRLSALFAALLFLSATAFSQNITLSGNIKDTTEKKPVKNAVVALLTVKDSILMPMAVLPLKMLSRAVIY
jgi:YbbR domain-containing protein